MQADSAQPSWQCPHGTKSHDAQLPGSAKVGAAVGGSVGAPVVDALVVGASVGTLVVLLPSAVVGDAVVTLVMTLPTEFVTPGSAAESPNARSLLKPGVKVAEAAEGLLVSAIAESVYSTHSSARNAASEQLTNGAAVGGSVGPPLADVFVLGLSVDIPLRLDDCMLTVNTSDNDEYHVSNCDLKVN